MVNLSQTRTKTQGYSTFLEENGNTGNDKYFTVDEAIEHIGFGKFHLWMTAAVGLWVISNTMVLHVMYFLGPLLQCEWGLSYLQIALITTAVFCGFCIAGPFLGYIGDRYSRTTSLTYSSALTLYFGFLCGFAVNYYWMLILRLITGIGLGGLAVITTYYAEFIPRKSRGKIFVMCGIFVSAGALLLVVLASAMLPFFHWRVWVAVTPLTFAFMIIMFWQLPTSPRFDASAGNFMKATKTLKLMAEINKTSLPDGILVQPKEKVSQGNIKSLFVPKLRLTTILVWIVWFLGMFIYYGTLILTSELISYGSECVTTSTAFGGMLELPCRLGCYGLQTDDLIALMISTFAEFPTTMLIALIIDPLGRKNSMILVSLVGCLSFFLLLICVNRTYIIGLLLISRGSALGLLLIITLYTSEVYPTECRSMAGGCSSSIGRMGGMVMPFVAQVLLAYSPPIGVSLFGALNLLFAFTCYCLPYETSGKGME